MPLTLCMRKGDVFYVGEVRVVLSAIRHATSFILELEDREVWVDSKEWVSMLEEVKVIAGTQPENRRKAVQVVIQAPKKVPIFRKSFKKVSVVCPVCKGAGVMSIQDGCPRCKGYGCAKCHSSGKITVQTKCMECGG